MTSVASDDNLDFKHFINLALLNKLPWDSLVFVLKDWSTTLEESKEVIEVLVKELQKLHSENSTHRIQSENVSKLEQTLAQENANEIDDLPQIISEVNQENDDTEKEKSDCKRRKLDSTGKNICNICGFKFSRPQSLRIHERIHEIQMPKKNQEIDETDKEQSDSKHLKQDSNMKNICSICGHGFSRLESLKFHERFHILQENAKLDKPENPAKSESIDVKKKAKKIDDSTQSNSYSESIQDLPNNLRSFYEWVDTVRPK